jgi:hypothetical protein
VVGEPGDDGRVPVRSKGFGIRGDGSIGSLVYDDLVVETTGGWRISRRTVTVRRVAGFAPQD